MCNLNQVVCTVFHSKALIYVFPKIVCVIRNYYQNSQFPCLHWLANHLATSAVFNRQKFIEVLSSQC